LITKSAHQLASARQSFEERPARTVAEAGERIFQLTGLRRGPSQVRKFVKYLGMKWRFVRAIPVPPKINNDPTNS
jgi:transposase